MKINLWRLAPGDKFKFHEKSDLFELVKFDIRFVDEPYDRQICIIRNLNTGRFSSTQSFIDVHIKPFEFYEQLSLF